MRKNHKILLVDDDSDDRFLFREALLYADANANFFVASNGNKAMEILEKHRQLPDIIFLDLNMPLRDGRECLRAIRTNRKWNALPIIIYSTTISPSDTIELQQSGATKVLQKPNDFMELCTLLDRILEKLFRAAD